MTATAATAGALPFLLQRSPTRSSSPRSERLIYVLPVLVFVVMTFRAAADWVSTVVGGLARHQGRRRPAHRACSTRSPRADLAWLQRTHSGRFVSAFVNDTPLVDRAAAKVMTTLFKNGLSVIFLVGAMFYMDWRLSLLVLIGAPAAFFNLSRQKLRIRKSVRRSLQESGDLGSMLTQTLQGMRVVKAYSQEEREAQRFRQIVANIRKYLMRTSARAPPSVRSRRRSPGSAWRPRFSTAAGRAFTATSRSAISWASWRPPCWPSSRCSSLATTQATLSEGLLAAARIFAMIDHASHVTEKPGAEPLRVTRARSASAASISPMRAAAASSRTST